MFVMPTVQLMIFPLAANFEVKNVRVAYIDHDHSSYSHQLRNRIAASGYFKMSGNPGSFREGLELVERGSADLLLEIPAGFERNLVRDRRQQLNLSVDAINGTKASIGAAYLQRHFDFVRLDLKVKSPEDQFSPQVKVEIISSFWYNPHADTKYYMVPAILVILLTMIGGFISALNIVREKDGGIEQINVSPVKVAVYPRQADSILDCGDNRFTIGLLVMYLFYGILPEESAGVVPLCSSLQPCWVGLLISLGRTQLQAMFSLFP